MFLKKYKTEIILCAIFAALFGISAVISHGTVKVFVIGASFGVFCLICGLPYLDNKKWKKSITRNVFTGAVAAAVIAFSLRLEATDFLLAVAIGSILGFFGETIAKHAPLP